MRVNNTVVWNLHLLIVFSMVILNVDFKEVFHQDMSVQSMVMLLVVFVHVLHYYIGFQNKKINLK